MDLNSINALLTAYHLSGGTGRVSAANAAGSVQRAGAVGGIGSVDRTPETPSDTARANDFAQYLQDALDERLNSVSETDASAASSGGLLAQYAAYLNIYQNMLALQSLSSSLTQNNLTSLGLSGLSALGLTSLSGAASAGLSPLGTTLSSLPAAALSSAGMSLSAFNAYQNILSGGSDNNSSGNHFTL